MWAAPRGVTVDSGAADHVIPRGWIQFIEIVASIGSKLGVHYIAANGSPIPNEGQQTVEYMSREGILGKITFQVASVNQTIGIGWKVH